MKVSLLCILASILFFVPSSVSSQNIVLKFKGVGASNIIDSIKVEHINSGTKNKINGDDILLLNNIDIAYSPDDIKRKPRIHPNPMVDFSVFEFYSSEKAIVEVFTESGESVVFIQNTLEEARHSYRIDGLTEGLYFVKLATPSFTYIDTLTSQNNAGSNLNPNIIYLGNQKSDDNLNSHPNKDVDAVMNFRSKDMLKFTAYAGNNTTIKIMKPKKDKEVVFNFAPCRDAEDNDYAIVKIGNQLWMAENLRTTQFNDSSEIAFIADPKTWGATRIPAFSWYEHNRDDYGNKLGALYNWYVVDYESNGNRNVCPEGWHLPSSKEWMMLINHLGGASVAGSKIKESNDAFWDIETTTYLNESGFSALPGGNRFLSGTFDNVGKRGYWWSNTEYYAVYAWSNILFFSPMDILKNTYLKNYGFSIRCVRY